MSELQFHFNPLSPNPGGGGKFPWLWILLAIAITGMVAKELHKMNKSAKLKSLNEGGPNDLMNHDDSLKS